MKRFVLVFLTAILSANLFFGYTITWAGQSQNASKRPDIQLSVIYPNDIPDGSLSNNDVNAIENSLARHLGQYTSASLYINCYPRQDNMSQEAQVNFQLIITCKNGCIFESRRTYTTKDKLTRFILEKVTRGFQTMEQSMQDNFNTTKVTF